MTHKLSYTLIMKGGGEKRTCDTSDLVWLFLKTERIIFFIFQMQALNITYFYIKQLFREIICLEHITVEDEINNSLYNPV